MKNDDVIKRYRLLIDYVIEDMESFIETESNLSYQDELYTRLLDAGSQFILAEIKRAREECYEQMDDVIGENDEDEFWSISIPDFIRNKLRAEQRAKLQALKEEL